MKRLLALFVLLLSIFTIIKLHYKCSDGFRADKVVYRKSYNPQLEAKQDIQTIMPILNQEFSYLGKGRQVYVFESADKCYVIKFLRSHKYQRPYWTYLFENVKKTKIMLMEQSIRYYRAMNSYQIASNELCGSTEVIYMHLNRTKNLHKKVIVKDKIGRKIKIDLDSCGFIIQKKADSYEDILLANLKNNEIEKVNAMISSFIETTAERVANGIYNRDLPNAVRNAGSISNRYIDIDIGSYYKAHNSKSAEVFKEEVIGFTEDLRKFLEKNNQEYVSFFDSKVAEAIIKYNRVYISDKKK